MKKQRQIRITVSNKYVNRPTFVLRLVTRESCQCTGEHMKLMSSERKRIFRSLKKITIQLSHTVV